MAVLILTNITAIIWYETRPSLEEASRSNFPYIDPARNFISQDNFIVNIQPLRVSVNDLVDEFGRGRVSVYIEFLNTGANIAINPNLTIWPASLPKVPLAMAVMKKVEKGVWDMQNELVLLEEDRDSRSGHEYDSLWEYPIGTRFTIERLLREVLVNSDNTAQKILMRNMHEDELRAVVDAVGLESVLDEEGKLSAKEYSRFFRSLYTSSFLSRANSQRILDWLNESPFEDFLSTVVPEEIPFPHKYGQNVPLRVYADSGIVYLEDRAYLITVMVQEDETVPSDIAGEHAREFMRNISLETYNYFLNYSQ